ncbi:MAG: ExbD/TolR family protein [Thermoguttaceae bacterium]
MKRKKTGHKKIELNMTSMIDVVFLLLVFFVMTFKIVAPEGDFSIKMPPASAEPEQNLDQPPEPLRVQLTAAKNGSLANIYIGTRNLQRNFDALRRVVLEEIQRRGGPDRANVDVELAPDDRLRYEFVIDALTAVSGEVRDGQIYKICDKIKFAPRRKG